MQTEAPNYATLLPQLPRLLHRYLSERSDTDDAKMLRKLLKQQKRNNGLLIFVSVLLFGLIIWEAFRYYAH
jgi:ubiquinone biosynthesis protein